MPRQINCWQKQGSALEELAGRLYEETSRKGLKRLYYRSIKGYWDRAGIEIDLVAVSESTRRIRFVMPANATPRQVTCKPPQPPHQQRRNLPETPHALRELGCRMHAIAPRITSLRTNAAGDRTVIDRSLEPSATHACSAKPVDHSQPGAHFLMCGIVAAVLAGRQHRPRAARRPAQARIPRL